MNLVSQKLKPQAKVGKSTQNYQVAFSQTLGGHKSKTQEIAKENKNYNQTIYNINNKHAIKQI